MNVSVANSESSEPPAKKRMVVKAENATEAEASSTATGGENLIVSTSEGSQVFIQFKRYLLFLCPPHSRLMNRIIIDTSYFALA